MVEVRNGLCIPSMHVMTSTQWSLFIIVAGDADLSSDGIAIIVTFPSLIKLHIKEFRKW